MGDSTPAAGRLVAVYCRRPRRGGQVALQAPGGGPTLSFGRSSPAMRTPLALSWLALGLLLADAAGLRAQEGARRFVPFDMQGDLEGLVRERLKLAQDLEPLKALVEKFQAGPGKLGLDPRVLQGLDVHDPRLQDLVRQWGGGKE